MAKNTSKKSISKSTKLWVFTLPIFYLLVQVLSNFPILVERLYSDSLFLFIRSVLHFLLSWIPLSVGDLFYIFIVSYAIRLVIGFFQNRFKNWKWSLIQGVALTSQVYFFFHLIWGLNYYRTPIHEQLEINNDYTTFELIDFTEKLILRTNELHLSLKENDSLPVNFQYTHDEISEQVFNGIEAVDEPKLNLTYGSRNLKKSLFSLPLTYGGFGGYINPFTLEAQYNYNIPTFKWPTTITHEVAHQMGFAKENEANFVACLVGMNHKDESFRYATLGFALKQCLNELFRRDPHVFEELKQCVNFGVIQNYRELQEFWEGYQNPVEPLLKVMYGSYLNVNNQPEGMASYSYVVALLVNYDFGF